MASSNICGALWITMGVGTILNSKRAPLITTGNGKVTALAQAIEGKAGTVCVNQLSAVVQSRAINTGKPREDQEKNYCETSVALSTMRCVT
jgi:hypothetical protein